MIRSRRWLSPVLVLAATACGAGPGRTVPVDFGQGPEVLEGFAACHDGPQSPVDLSSDEPLVVIVHGCSASGSEFRAMSELFEFNGQRAICFNYDDRHRMRTVGRTLRRGLDTIRARTPERAVTVLGHSQGGLISRIALSEVDGARPPGNGALQLVTVSSPFSGIAAAEHCGFIWLHVLSFGITPGICQAISGAKWTEITPAARLWQEPRPLDSSVAAHLQIVTDEEGTCRRHEDDGGCAQDDYVFSMSEQSNAGLTADPRFRARTLSAGHAAVTGSDGSVPRELIVALQQEGVLGRPSAGQELAFERLVQALF